MYRVFHETCAELHDMIEVILSKKCCITICLIIKRHIATKISFAVQLKCYSQQLYEKSDEESVLQ
jgi:hypothetical protein